MTKSNFNVGKISKDESKLFDAIRDPGYNNFALMKISVNDIETSCICSINEGDQTEYNIQPLAILVNEKLTKNLELKNPAGELLS